MPKASHLFAVTSLLAQGVTILCIGILGLLAVALAALLPAALGLYHLPIPAKYLDGVDVQTEMAAATLVVLGASACVALSAFVLVLISRIVDSAKTGDPFVSDNAARLNNIGWLLLVIQGVGFVTGVALAQFPPKITQHIDFGFDLSVSGVFAALLVFVLAQIFQRGSEMRAELEGTV